MKHISLFMAGLFLVVVLASCNEDDEIPEPIIRPNNTCLADNVITISDIADIPEQVVFNKVRVEIQGFEWQTIDVVEVPYQEGKAILTLPAEFPVEKLCKVCRSDVFDYVGFWPAATDNPDAKVAGFLDIVAYHNDKRVGRLELTDWSGEGSTANKMWIYYHYTNQPFTLSGYNFTTNNNQKSYKYEASFKQGWNAYANIKQSDEGIVLCTTSIPEETPLVWRFK